MNLLRIKHALNGYHHRKRPASKIAVCHCGWRDKRFRRLHRKMIVRRIVFCSWRGCKWEEPEEASVGPAGAPDEEFTSLGYMKQCERCWRLVDAPNS